MVVVDVRAPTGFTVMVNGTEVLGANSGSPLYTAVYVWVATERVVPRSNRANTNGVGLGHPGVAHVGV